MRLIRNAAGSGRQLDFQALHAQGTARCARLRPIFNPRLPAYARNMRLIVDRCIFLRAFIRRGLFGRVRFQRSRFLSNLRIGTKLLTTLSSSVIDGRLPILVSRIADRRSRAPVRSLAIDRRRPPPISSAPEEAVSSPCSEGDTADVDGCSARPEPEALPSSKASAEGKGTDIAKDVASTRDNAVFFFEKRMGKLLRNGIYQYFNDAIIKAMQQCSYRPFFGNDRFESIRRHR